MVTRRLQHHQPRGLAASEGATGTRAPHGRPGGRLSSGPSRPGRACSRALLVSPLGPFGVPWVALRHPRYGDFCPGTLFGLPLRPIAGARAVAMQPLGGRRFPAIAGASSLAGFPGLPDLDALLQAPIAATWCWIQAPSQAATGTYAHRMGLERGHGFARRRWSRKPNTTLNLIQMRRDDSRVSLLLTTGTISRLTPEPRNLSAHSCNSRASSHPSAGSSG